jgi:tripartite ATP-independent transporter DctM subunit
VFSALFVTFLVLMFGLGAPLAICMVLSSMAALWYHGTLPGAAPISFVVTPQRMFTIVDSFPLMAVPYFILAGELMERGGISLRLVKFAVALVGRIRGGICLAAVLASMIFAGVSGSGAADTAAVGSLTIPAMIKKGYPRGFVAALQAVAGAIGPIIPPSIVMLIYASIANQSPARMFLGGVLPGILIGVGLMVVSYVYSVRHGYGAEAAAGWREVLRAAVDASWALVSPVIILGGILSGVFTATEAGVIAVVYALLVGVFVYGEIRWTDLPAALVKAAITTSIVMFVVAASGIFGWLLAAARAPVVAAQFLMSLTSNRFLIFLIVIVFLLIVGGLMEEAASIIILVPVLHPLAQRFGINELHWAVILSMTLVVGAVTPPVASFLFISSAIAKTTIGDSSRNVWIFLAVMVGVILLSVIIPGLVLFLPRILIG